MGITSQIQGSVRQGSRRAYSSGGTQTLDLNMGGDILMSPVLPERAELVRMGYSFGAQVPAASAWTLLITIPTTLAGLSLQNGESSGGKAYIIDRFWIKAVTSTGSAGVITPLAQVVVPGTALVADDTAVLRYNLSGSSRTSRAQLVMASVLTGCVINKWMHFASALQSMTTNIAACIEVLCYGRYIVPPQGSFNINAQESVSGGTAIAGVEWHEVQMDLG